MKWENDASCVTRWVLFKIHSILLFYDWLLLVGYNAKMSFLFHPQKAISEKLNFIENYKKNNFYFLLSKNNHKAFGTYELYNKLNIENYCFKFFFFKFKKLFTRSGSEREWVVARVSWEICVYKYLLTYF